MIQTKFGHRSLSSHFNVAGETSFTKSQESYFRKNLAPLEKELETLRIAYYRKQIIWLACFSLLVGITLAWIYPFEWGLGEIIIVVWFLPLSYAALKDLVKKGLDNYNKIYQSRGFPAILSYFDNTFTFSRDCPWSLEKLKRFGILPAFNRVDEISYVRGTYRTVEIEMLNTTLVSVTASENRNKTTTFSGPLILLTLKKTFFGRTIVTPDKVLAPILILGGMQCIQLESPEFNKLFNVYSEDQIEARTLLTPSFMQRLLELQKLINQPVNYGFCSGKLMIPVDGVHNNFDVQSIDRKVDIRQKFKSICDDLQIIFEVVDILKLDLDIGL